MKPESFTWAGYLVLLAGFCLTGVGSILFGRIYFCIANLATCGLSPNEVTTQLGYAIPTLVFGVLLLLMGTVFTSVGHMTEHLRSTLRPPAAFLRVCVKCGRHVDPSATYCPNCGEPAREVVLRDAFETLQLLRNRMGFNA